MTANERREEIIRNLVKEKKAITGSELASYFNVTRQVIVKDIAILRAAGKNIIATPDGYMINDNSDNRVKSVIAVNHTEDEMESELEIVVKYGGIIEDVIVEHPLYGEIKGIKDYRAVLGNQISIPHIEAAYTVTISSSSTRLSLSSFLL